MGRAIRRCCLPCVAVGLGLVMFGSGALAQSGQTGIPHGPGWVEWFTILLGALLAVTGAYIKGLVGRVDSLEKAQAEKEAKIAAIRERIAGDYHTKVELQQIVQSALAPLQVEMTIAVRGMEAVHRRLDAMGAPRTVDGRSLMQGPQ